MEMNTTAAMNDDKKAKTAMNRREQYRLLVMSESIMAYVINISTDIIENEFYQLIDGQMQPVLEFLGMTPPCSFTEVYQTIAERHVHEKDREEYLRTHCQEYLQKAYERGEEKLVLEYRATMIDGYPMHLRTVAFLVKHKETDDILAYVTDRDITDTKSKESIMNQLASQLSNTKESYEMMHRVMDSAMWRIEFGEDGRAKQVVWSDEFRKMLGYKDNLDAPNTLAFFKEILHPEDWTPENDLISRTLKAQPGEKKSTVDYRLKTKHRGYRWYRATGKISRRPDGSPYMFYGVLFDINEQKVQDILIQEKLAVHEETLRLQEELNFQMENIQRFHEMIHSGMWSMDFDDEGNISKVSWSDAFRHLFGFNNEKDFPNKLESWSERVHPSHRYQVLKNFNAAIKDPKGTTIYEQEYQFLTKSGTYRWYHAIGKVARKDGKPVKYLGTCVDVTEKKEYDMLVTERILRMEESERLNLALQDALQQAQHANRAKTQFLNNMSHDIRTPMNAIIGFTNLAISHVDKSDLVKDYLGKIMTSSNHLLSLINDVLDMSRIESGKVKIEEKECNLPDIMHDLKTIVQADIHSKRLDFYIDTVDVVDEDFFCDKLRLNQILLNVLSNAMKFTEPGGLVSVRIIQKADAPPGYASYVFRIRDTGIGMSKEFQQHLFEPFERERNSTVSGIQGTGLGMAITKNIVDMMNGTIEVESEEGKGTEFIISLQFRLSSNPKKVEPIPELVGMRALVVDDDFNTCASVTKMLASIGMQPDWSTSGKEAILRSKLAMEQNKAFFAYIIDWLMPDMNGIEVVRRIRKIIGDTAPIIISTSYDWSEIEEEAREAGVTAFCSKPLFLSDVRETFMHIISEPDQQEEEPEEEISFEGKSILLVEDNELNSEIAATLLEQVGFKVEIADNGSVAVEKVKTSKPGTYDVILMDILMPVMNGYEATRNIRKLDDPALANIPIIAMTANVFDEDKQMAKKIGMNGHLGKPINLEELYNMLTEILQ